MPPRPASSSYLCLLATLLLLLVLGCTEAFSYLAPASSRQSAGLMARGPAAAAAAAAGGGPYATPRFPSLLVRQAATAAGEIDVRLLSGGMDGWTNG